MPLQLNHQTPQEFALRFWQRVKTAWETGDKVKYSRLLWWLYNRVQDGDITSAQARSSFNTAFNRNLTATEWNTLVTTRLLPAAQRYQSILDESEL